MNGGGTELVLDRDQLQELETAAWKVRERSRVLGRTKVGCAVLDDQGQISVGCNVEHQFRSHDVHAEVNAIASLVAAGGTRLVAAFVVAERQNFTPCGGCLDWIFELGGPDCVVLCQSARGAQPARYRAADLMPHYPRP